MKRTTAFLIGMLLLVGCKDSYQGSSPGASRPLSATSLRGATSYTPYDALAMLWYRSKRGREVIWTSSGQESGQLLVSKASTERRPDWIFCTQGVVAGLSAKKETPVIIGTVYVSSDAILPVFRHPRTSLAGGRSLFIPRSSIEFAFDRLLAREGLSREQVRVPAVERPGFPLIASMLAKPVTDKDALDFAILVDPFITNLLEQSPGGYELGEGGLYEMHYSLVARAEDLAHNRVAYKRLIQELIDAEGYLNSLRTDEEFYENVWGRTVNGKPDTLPRLVTYRPGPVRISINPPLLRKLLTQEVSYLTQKYPDQLVMPSAIDELVDPSLLREVDPSRVIE